MRNPLGRVVIDDHSVAPRVQIQLEGIHWNPDTTNLFSLFYVRVRESYVRNANTQDSRGCVLTVAESIQLTCALSSVRPTSKSTSYFRR